MQKHIFAFPSASVNSDNKPNRVYSKKVNITKSLEYKNEYKTRKYNAAYKIKLV